MRMAIQGIGIVAGFGCGLEALRSALQSGRIATQQSSHELNGAESLFSSYRASLDGLDAFVPKRSLRRIDHFSRMALYGAHLALEDAGLLDADRSRVGVVIASGYGPLQTTFNFLDSYLDYGYACSSPTHFSNSVHNAAAAHVSMQLQMTAPSLTVTQFEMSVASALLTAQLWLAEGRVDQVLFGAVDEYCDVLRYCRERFFAAAEQGPLQPFDFDVQSAMVGEGAAFLLLSRAEGETSYGCIDSVTLGNHLANPIKLSPDDLLIIGADGHRDRGHWYAQTIAGHEAAAYAPLYGSFPAAAGLDLAVAALSLRDRTLYASPGLKSATAQAATTHRALGENRLACLKFGHGGDYGLVRLSN